MEPGGIIRLNEKQQAFADLKAVSGWTSAEISRRVGCSKAHVTNILKGKINPGDRLLDDFHEAIEQSKMPSSEDFRQHSAANSAEQNRARGVNLGTHPQKERNARMKYPEVEEGFGTSTMHEADTIAKKFRQLTPEDQKEVEHIIRYKLRNKKPQAKSAEQTAIETQDDAAKIAGIKKKGDK